MPGCCVRIGCDGSGRGPPAAACGGPDTPGAAARRARGRGAARRRAPADARRSFRPGGGAAADGRPLGRGVRSWPAAARSAARAPSAAAASASSAAVLRCAAAASAARRGRAGPASAGAAAGAGSRARAAASRCSATGAAPAAPRRPTVFRRRFSARRLALLRRRLRARSRATARSGGRAPASASASAPGAGAGFAVLTRRGGGSAGAAGFDRLGRLLRRRAPFLPLTTGVSAKMSPPGSEMLRWRARRSTNWPRDDLFDRARRALHLDAVIALEQRGHFLARGAEQFRDLVNPDSGQTLIPAQMHECKMRSACMVAYVRFPVRRSARRLAAAPRPESSRRFSRRCRESPTAARPTAS